MNRLNPFYWLATLFIIFISIMEEIGDFIEDVRDDLDTWG